MRRLPLARPNKVISKNMDASFNYISSKASIGKNVQLGRFNIIEDDVVIGDNTIIKSYVELRKGTIIGRDCYIDSRVASSGDCIIGDNVTLRYDSIIARGCRIDDNVYVCPRVMTNNLDTGGESIGGAHIKKNCFIGTNAVLHHGLTIGENSIIGSLAFVNKDVPANEIWLGSPAKKFRDIEPK